MKKKTKGVIIGGVSVLLLAGVVGGMAMLTKGFQSWDPKTWSNNASDVVDKVKDVFNNDEKESTKEDNETNIVVDDENNKDIFPNPPEIPISSENEDHESNENINSNSYSDSTNNENKNNSSLNDSNEANSNEKNNSISSDINESNNNIEDEVYKYELKVSIHSWYYYQENIYIHEDLQIYKYDYDKRGNSLGFDKVTEKESYNYSFFVKTPSKPFYQHEKSDLKLDELGRYKFYVQRDNVKSNEVYSDVKNRS